MHLWMPCCPSIKPNFGTINPGEPIKLQVMQIYSNPKQLLTYLHTNMFGNCFGLLSAITEPYNTTIQLQIAVL